MNMGIFINQPFFNCRGEYTTSRAFIKFIESFSSYFDNITIFAPTKSSGDQRSTYRVNSKKINICPLPYYLNIQDLLRRSLVLIPKSLNVLIREIPRYDLFWLVLPHPLSLIFYIICKRYSKPVFTHIRGSIEKDIYYRYRGIAKVLAKLYARSMVFSNHIICNRELSLAVGSELYRKYKNENNKIFTISPSLITLDDIEQGRESIESHFKNEKETKLLFVGRVEPEKGLEYLFQAIRILNQESKKNYSLSVVGKSHLGNEEKERRIKALANKKGLSELINFSGYIPHGHKLFNLYKKSDIFVLPSLIEGIPKVLYEAMAKGLPIIATKVGGIPDIIEDCHNGLLIKPGSVDTIVKAVGLLEEDKEFRHRIIKNGLETARQHTIEKARDQMIRYLNENLTSLDISLAMEGGE